MPREARPARRHAGRRAAITATSLEEACSDILELSREGNGLDAVPKNPRAPVMHHRPFTSTAAYV
ncbi:MAG: hypothetical protein QM611_06975 [Microbacterium sp.]|uniref:hypothetical protein n=1 Tax=Microbacterium sp. TaxID=51671 RepID=UPI0039E43538